MTRKPLSVQDFPLTKGKLDVNLHTFALLFSEVVKYTHVNSKTAVDFHDHLSSIGIEVGQRLVDILYMSERGSKRDIRMNHILLFVKSQVWRHLFGKELDSLQRASNVDNVYYLHEHDSVLCKFISTPKDQGGLNCSAFSAGIIQGFLTAACFPCKVEAMVHEGTAYQVTFDESVVARERSLESR